MHPAHELLVLIVIALHAVLPLGTWVMLAGYRDAHARIWLAGVVWLFAVCPEHAGPQQHAFHVAGHFLLVGHLAHARSLGP